MLQMITSLTPDAPWPFEPVQWEAEPLPSEADVLKLTLSRLAANPAKAARLQLRLVRNVADAAG
jgi:diacylglycerol O-acyltransferase / wax synthase